MEKSYGTVNSIKIHSLVQQPNNKKMSKFKEEKCPLLDSESQSDSTEPPPSDTVLDLDRSVNNAGSIKRQDYNPLLNRDLEHPTSNFDTMVHLLKGNIGTGILAMPDAFRNAGWVVGIFGTLLIGAICTHCMHILVGCAHELCKRTQLPSLSFAEVTEVAFQTGPEWSRKWAWVFKCCINTFLCITQIGFCCVYFVFVAANLHDIAKNYFGDWQLHWYLCILLVPMICLNCVKNLKYLAPVSLCASVLTVSGLMITFFYMLQGLPQTSSVNAFSPWHTLPLYFGTAIYAFEGIGVVLPLENNMKTPQDFRGWTGVLNTGMVIVACLYTAVGFFGYLKFGDLAQQGSITLYLPADEILAQAVRLMMALAIFLSYGLQFYVPFNVMWPSIKDCCCTRFEFCKWSGEYIARALLVTLTFVLASLIPNLGTVIAFVGAFSSSALALIFPPIIEIVTFWPDRLGEKNWILWKDGAIALFGLVGFGFGTYASLLNMANSKT